MRREEERQGIQSDKADESSTPRIVRPHDIGSALRYTVKIRFSSILLVLCAVAGDTLECI